MDGRRSEINGGKSGMTKKTRAGLSSPQAERRERQREGAAGGKGGTVLNRFIGLPADHHYFRRAFWTPLCRGVRLQSEHLLALARFSARHREEPGVPVDRCPCFRDGPKYRRDVDVRVVGQFFREGTYSRSYWEVNTRTAWKLNRNDTWELAIDIWL